MDGNEQGDYGDEQGTRVGAPDQERTPATHSDSSPNRDERQTGTGAEAVAGTDTPVDEHDREHRSGYGGSGGKPVSSSDQRK
ncbi:MAG: hypothetical protein ACJ8AO_06855 [Gemmatimonadaceae bacterium]